MDLAQFTSRVKAGAKLTILDDLVLSLENYAFQHPGGEKVLINNIGRDLSKFFYGGYAIR